MDTILSQYSGLILAACLVVIALLLIGIVFCAAASDSSKNDPTETIVYNQNGYHSNLTGYQVGKYTKNNTYNGR